MIDHEPHVEQSEAKGWDDEEVHTGDHVLVVSKERGPALALAVVGFSWWQIPRHGCEANCEPELQELSLNLPGPPVVFACESTDEHLQLLGDWRPPGTALRDPSPIEAEALPMPAHNGVRLDDHPGVSPARPEPGQRDPESTIQRCETRLRVLLGVRCELLAQGQLDDHLLIVATEEGEATAKKCQREIEERLHRRETLRDISAQRQTDSLPDTAVP